MMDAYYEVDDVEETFSEFSRYEVTHPDLILEREEELEGDDMDVMIPIRGTILPSQQFYSGCVDEEPKAEPPLSGCNLEEP